MKSKTLKPVAIIISVLAAVVFLVSVSPFGELFSWQFDLIRGYEYSFPTQTVKDHEITLVHRAGGDFYDTYFEIRSAKGKVYRFWVDGDDHRWSDPQTKVVGNRIYYLPKSGEITSRTSYIDKDTGIIYAGYLRQTAELSQNSRPRVSGAGYALGIIE